MARVAKNAAKKSAKKAVAKRTRIDKSKWKRKCMQCENYLQGDEDKARGICHFCTMLGVTRENLRTVGASINKYAASYEPGEEVRRPKKSRYT